MIIKVGIIGCGWISENAHIPSLLKIQEVKITAVYDINSTRAYYISEKFRIDHAYNDIEEFVNSGIEAAVIATPNFTHADYTRKLMNNGIHVLCEKPVALSKKDIREISDMAKANNIIYVPGFVNRWRQDIQRIRSEIALGRVGNILEIQAGWIRKNGVPRPGTWFTNRSMSGGGVLVDLGSHILDICLMLLGNRNIVDQNLKMSLCSLEKLKNGGAANWFLRDDEKHYEIDVEDNAEVTVLFDDSTKMNVRLSWLADTDADYTYFTIIGDRGKLELRTLFGFSNERLWKEDQLIFDNSIQQTKLSLDSKENNSRNAFDRMHEYFIASIQNKKTDFTDCRDAIKTVSLIEKLYKSVIG